MPEIFSKADVPVYANALAKTLKLELGDFVLHMEDHHRSALISKLHDEPPHRHDLLFQMQGGAAAPKIKFGPALADKPEEPDYQAVYCMAHTAFVPLSGIDIEHALSHSHIRDNQKQLLSFLNTQPHFADAFLSQPGISDLLRRDDKDRRIKGTALFYKLSYNAEGNLWLLCHAYNIKKGNHDALEWFRTKKIFSNHFINAVYESGGLHRGVIIDRIYVPTPDELTIEVDDGPLIALHHTDRGYGLGEFIRSWFMKNHENRYQTERKFHVENYGQLKDRIEAIEAIVDAPTSEDKHTKVDSAFSRLKKDLARLVVVHKALIQAAEEISSSSDSEEGSFSQKTSHEHIYYSILTSQRKCHEGKK